MGCVCGGGGEGGGQRQVLKNRSLHPRGCRGERKALRIAQSKHIKEYENRVIGGTCADIPPAVHQVAFILLG